MKTHQNQKILKVSAENAGKVAEAIRLAGMTLSRIEGVVGVRPGLKFIEGRVTNQPVVELSILPGTDRDAVRASASALMEQDQVEVTVVLASLWDLKKFAEKNRENLNAESAAQLEGVTETGDEAAEAVQEFLEYKPPAQPLTKVETDLELLCHASPDAGFRILSDFFSQTAERLTATMYEFTADHVLAALKSGLSSPRKLHLIMDGQADENARMRTDLEDTLTNRCACLWAAVADTPGKTVDGFFPTAYHIKVSVRDGETTWLSSGNWKDSNQPAVDPILGPFPSHFDGNSFHRKHNRDWHVVAKGRALAEQFERYIEHDMAQALPLQAAGTQEIQGLVLDLFVPEEDVFGVEEAVEFFSEKFFTCRNVMPLLTPDNYADHVLPIIRNASTKLYFQNQSLSTSVSRSPRYAELVEALKEKVNDPNIDARVIVRGDFDPRKIVKALAHAGFDMSRIKLQTGCHTKGILVDGEVTVVGSHNWTGQGTTQNRDASLIIPDSNVTKYYERFFLHDWDKRTMEEVPEDTVMARLAFPGEATPPGMVRVSWRDVMGDLPPDWE